MHKAELTPNRAGVPGGHVMGFETPVGQYWPTPHPPQASHGPADAGTTTTTTSQATASTTHHIGGCTIANQKEVSVTHSGANAPSAPTATEVATESPCRSLEK